MNHNSRFVRLIKKINFVPTLEGNSLMKIFEFAELNWIMTYGIYFLRQIICFSSDYFLGFLRHCRNADHIVEEIRKFSNQLSRSVSSHKEAAPISFLGFNKFKGDRK